jgi:hypothetical protein
MALLAYYILQVDVDYKMNQGIILAGNYHPNADEAPLAGNETISEVWPMKSPKCHVNVFARWSTSK